jgi:hypothetical protein
MGEISGCAPDVRSIPIDGTTRGSIADVSKRLSITGPCTVSWRDGLRRVFDERHGGRIGTGPSGQSAKLLGEVSRVRRAIDENE